VYINESEYWVPSAWNTRLDSDDEPPAIGTRQRRWTPERRTRKKIKKTRKRSKRLWQS